jgi:hypothetical protein
MSCSPRSARWRRRCAAFRRSGPRRWPRASRRPASPASPATGASPPRERAA